MIGPNFLGDHVNITYEYLRSYNKNLAMIIIAYDTRTNCSELLKPNQIGKNGLDA